MVFLKIRVSHFTSLTVSFFESSSVRLAVSIFSPSRGLDSRSRNFSKKSKKSRLEETSLSPSRKVSNVTGPNNLSMDCQTRPDIKAGLNLNPPLSHVFLLPKKLCKIQAGLIIQFDTRKRKICNKQATLALNGGSRHLYNDELSRLD